MYKIALRRRAQRALEKLPKSDFQAINDNERLITVVRVGHRREIYRAL